MKDIRRINDTVFHIMRAQGIIISRDYYRSTSRKRELVLARMLLIYFARLEGYTLQYIGAYCGNRNHTTILHACETISDLLDVDKTVRKYIGAIELELVSGNSTPESKVNHILRLFQRNQLSRLEALTLIMQ